MIDKLLGNLKITSKLGEGGMGVVYLAEHVTLGNRFAIKCLAAKLTDDAGFRERFYNEARNQALLDHPNIVQVTDFHEQDGQYFLVMQFVNGQALDDIIKKQGKLDEQTALHILKDILSGLNFAHSKGVIHRDMKPPNVIVDGDGRARITDFGIAILVGDKRLTAAGKLVGSWWYMSPEQIQTPTKIDHRSDVYSAGIVLYEMLTGDVPFDGESEFTIQNKQVNDPAPDPTLKNPAITPVLKQIILKALEKDPNKRFSGCGEFLSAIEHYELASRSPTGLKPLTVKLLATLVLVLLGLFSWGLYNYNKPIPPEPPIIVKVPDIKETAFQWIETASEKAAAICREVAALKHKQIFYEVGTKSNLGSSDLDITKKQIATHQANIKEYSENYNDYLVKLSSLEENLVKEQLEKYNNQLAQKEAFHRIQFSEIVFSHYQEMLQKKPIDFTAEYSWQLCGSAKNEEKP